MIATAGAGLSCLLIAVTTSQALIFLGIFLFGGFALPLYSLSAAHANDHVGPGQYVELAAGLTLSFALGAVFGPFLASMVMDMFGPQAFFIYTASLHFALVAFIAVRILSRAAVPVSRRKRFVWLLRNSPMIFKMARDGGRNGKGMTKDHRPTRDDL